MLAKIIPKAAGGFRPIMWFRSAYRVYARSRRHRVQEWYGRLSRAFPEVNMAAGRWTSDAMWRAMVRRDIAPTTQEAIEVNWDLQKAFDHVDRRKLWEAGRREGYPLSVLRLSLLSYGWSRRFLWNSEVSEKSMHSEALQQVLLSPRSSWPCI